MGILGKLLDLGLALDFTAPIRSGFKLAAGDNYEIMDSMAEVREAKRNGATHWDTNMDGTYIVFWD